ncbi:hypothetical protein GCM10010174_65810 [Kutzneria viridogrisea]|uniref:GAF domain-containing protein n=2 Tax=Kutzneria TaxID=43356 RepID=W5W9G3_9PSEU|nr:GAF domain-containing protein [Kutzneria albida]AHH97156.1 hypothetical protein KALB_3792 [Kutzneria albida DSM 43870]MBA8931873.1 hypothetical protein [Kutzneria viridogrisea]
MSKSTGQNLPGPLEHVTASYDDPASWSRLMRTATHTQSATQLAGYIDLSLDEPRAVQNMHEAAASLQDCPGLAAVLPKVLESAMSLMSAEAGNIQLLDPREGSLVLVTQLGFGPEFVDHFAVVDDGSSVCGRAASQCTQTVVVDVHEDPACAPHRNVFRDAGVRAVQSTPLLDHTGRMIGMVSTHLPHPGRPADRDLRIMGLYSQLAGEVIARHLRRTSPGAPCVPAPRDAKPAPRRPALSQLLADTINRIFDAGLRFAGAQSLTTDEHVAQRVRAGIATLDDTVRMVRMVQVALLDHNLGEHRNEHDATVPSGPGRPGGPQDATAGPAPTHDADDSPAGLGLASHCRIQ